MRQIDVNECRALGRTPKDALRMGIKTSIHALTAIDESGRPIAMFGVMPVSLVSGKGVPWFLGSDDVFDYPRDLLVTGPILIGWFQETFREMTNIVAVENDRAVRLLKRWGATFDGDHQMHGGMEFVPFRFERAIQASALAA